MNMVHLPEAHAAAPSHIRQTDAAAHRTRREFDRLHRGVYADPAVTLSATDRIRAAHLSAGPAAVVAGLSAHFLHGTRYPDISGDVEVIRDLRGQGRRRTGVTIIRTDRLGADDIVDISGMPVTSVVRTAYDLGRRRPDWLALGHLDDLARCSGLDLSQLWAYTRDHDRARGICQLRELVGLVDPLSESPGESWTRLIMHRHQLPRPESQIEVFDDSGALIARFDLGYRRYKIGIDYDGVDYHSSEEQKLHDLRRDGAVRQRGWIPLRTNAAALSSDEVGEMARIERALELRGHR
ncbi:Transcriptional regulator, AbiEi antitoxin, Type IV TA system [Williamsia deligens]|nr:Transcriptional regulator, AbiEi antitoxin, Type IV TA system [Williamsia deligens]